MDFCSVLNFGCIKVPEGYEISSSVFVRGIDDVSFVLIDFGGSRMLKEN